MAEREELQKRYAYSEMSNKVMSRGVRRDARDEGGFPVVNGGQGGSTGEVESLWNILPPLALGRMGDRLDRVCFGEDIANTKTGWDAGGKERRRKKVAGNDDPTPLPVPRTEPSST
jgi:hypothetical protein